MTQDIKVYSTPFATKVNYIINIINNQRSELNRTQLLEATTNEKITTINNWLFNKRKPKASKKLELADKLGVSYNYLFNDEIDVKDFSKPEIHYDGNQYLIPLVNEEDIFELKDLKLFAVNKRLPIMLPDLENFIQKYGKYIYITKLTKASFSPYITNNTNIIYSEKTILENFKLLIKKDIELNILAIARVISENNKFYLETINNQNKIKTEPFKETYKYLSIIFTYNI